MGWAVRDTRSQDWQRLRDRSHYSSMYIQKFRNEVKSMGGQLKKLPVEGELMDSIRTSSVTSLGASNGYVASDKHKVTFSRSHNWLCDWRRLNQEFDFRNMSMHLKGTPPTLKASSGCQHTLMPGERSLRVMLSFPSRSHTLFLFW